MEFSLEFKTPGYIAEPYWPEMSHLIDIQKHSGMNRAKSDESRRKALQTHLQKLSMSHDDYLELEKAAHRPFHTNGDGAIIIPGDRLLSCLVNAAYVARSANRLAKPEAIRTLLTASDFITGKSEADGTWERFARHEATNQRGLRSSKYISNFCAEGSIDFPRELVKPESLLQFLSFAGSEVGIGASRKMGWGRFTVIGGAS